MTNERIITTEAVKEMARATEAYFSSVKLQDQEAVIPNIPVDEIVEGGMKLVSEAARKMGVEISSQRGLHILQLF